MYRFRVQPAPEKIVVPRARKTTSPIVVPSKSAIPAAQASIGDEPIETLHLSTRSRNALAACGVRSVKALVLRANSGALESCTSGAKTVDDIRLALSAISSALRPDGIDWIEYASGRGCVILPKRKRPEWSPQAFIRAFPQVALAAVESQYGEREGRVFRQHILRQGAPTSLRKMARDLGCTGQAASLIKNNLLNLLKRTVFEGDYTACRFRFRSEFTSAIMGVRKALRQFQGHPLTHHDWRALLRDNAGETLSIPEAAEDLILAMFDYLVIRPSKASFEPILVANSGQASRIRAALVKSDHLLTRRFPSGLSERQIHKALGAKCGREEMRAVLSSILGLEKGVRQRLFRANIDKLTRVTDKLERILSDNNAVMPTRELAGRVKRSKGEVGTSPMPHQIAVLMSVDPRFKPVGRSGYWALSKWKHVETRTISDIAVELMKLHGGPLKESELYRLIRARRPVSAGSIHALLSESPRFSRVAPSTWELRGDSTRQG